MEIAMKSQFLAGLVFFSLCVSCAPRHEVHYTPHDHPQATADKTTTTPPAPPAPPAPSGDPDCATSNDKTLDPTRAVQRKSIDLKLERQMVVHQDCDGHEIRRGVEKVTLPSTEIILTPAKKTLAEWWGSFGGGSYATAFNRTTCTDAGAGNTLTKLLLLPFYAGQMMGDDLKSAMGFPRVRFTVNTSPTLLDMHVQRGQDNYIDYEFTKCEGGDATLCPNSKVIEKGTLVLTVNYSEDTLPGASEVKDCPDADPKK
jgi:hypothetical protein